MTIAQAFANLAASSMLGPMTEKELPLARAAFFWGANAMFTLLDKTLCHLERTHLEINEESIASLEAALEMLYLKRECDDFFRAVSEGKPCP